ncbi:MAG: alkaline phosphatase [Bacteriovoracaceae bacterium]|nr:alkaline phosphatase [Bacteriovoracaceae bacterium]
MKKIVFIFLLCVSFTTWSKSKNIKNVILLIGDGMGPQEISLAQTYLKYAPHSPFKRKDLYMVSEAKRGHLVLSFTNPYEVLVVDSASSATQLSTGKFSRSEMIGLDFEGNSQKTILEIAKEMGKSTGLVSDTRLTHATPAAFAAHVSHRNLENEIAEQMLQNSVDVMLSGGLRHFLPKSISKEDGESLLRWKEKVPADLKLKSKREDEKDLLLKAQESGYNLAFSKEQMEKISKGKLLGLFSESGMPNGIWMTQNQNKADRKIPTLQEMATTSLKLLSQNPKGFFLMVEGGQIDWAGHANDAGTMLHQMLHFDETIKLVLDWAAKRDDTVVILTADHETGSFGFSYHQDNIPEAKKLSGKNFENTLFHPNNNFGNYAILDGLYNQKKTLFDIGLEFSGLPSQEQTDITLCSLLNETNDFKLTADNCTQLNTSLKNLYGKSLSSYEAYEKTFLNDDGPVANLLARAIASQQNIVWGTGTHTSTPVSVQIWGPKHVQERFKGYLHHTLLGEEMIKILKGI